MAWSNKQKAMIVRACKAAGIADEHRRLIIAQVPEQRAVHQGRATSTSPRLNDGDFEFVMAAIESYSGGQVKLGQGFVHPPGHWQARLETGELRRMRWVIKQVDATLGQQLADWTPGGQSLGAWISNRVTDGRTSDPERLDYRELANLLHGLRALAKRHGVRLAA